MKYESFIYSACTISNLDRLWHVTMAALWRQIGTQRGLGRERERGERSADYQQARIRQVVAAAEEEVGLFPMTMSVAFGFLSILEFERRSIRYAVCAPRAHTSKSLPHANSGRWTGLVSGHVHAEKRMVLL